MTLAVAWAALCMGRWLWKNRHQIGQRMERRGFTDLDVPFNFDKHRSRSEAEMVVDPTEVLLPAEAEQVQELKGFLAEVATGQEPAGEPDGPVRRRVVVRTPRVARHRKAQLRKAELAAFHADPLTAPIPVDLLGVAFDPVHVFEPAPLRLEGPTRQFSRGWIDELLGAGNVR